MLPALGLSPETPLLGWVFSESWAASHDAALRGFLAAAKVARDALAGSPQEWQKIPPLAQVDDPRVPERLREAYPRGVRHGAPAHLAHQAPRLLHPPVPVGRIAEGPPA